MSGSNAFYVPGKGPEYFKGLNAYYDGVRFWDMQTDEARRGWVDGDNSHGSQDGKGGGSQDHSGFQWNDAPGSIEDDHEWIRRGC